MESLTSFLFCSLTVLPSRMTHKTFHNLAPHSLSETTITRKVIAWQSVWGAFRPFNRTVATGAIGHTTPETSVVSLWALIVRQAFRGIYSERPVFVKENIQPLKLSTVAVFFFVSTVFLPLSLGRVGRGVFLIFPFSFIHA